MRISGLCLGATESAASTSKCERVRASVQKTRHSPCARPEARAPPERPQSGSHPASRGAFHGASNPSALNDEANQDVMFLVHAVCNDMVTPLHERYLANFWADEFGDAASSQSRRGVA